MWIAALPLFWDRNSRIKAAQIIFISIIPVNDMKPVIYIICSFIIIFQIICVFPNIYIEYRTHS